MGNSILITQKIPAHPSNYTPNRAANNGKIKKITLHHFAAIKPAKNVGEEFQKANYGVSSHYGVSDNDVVLYVDEGNIAWTDANWNSNITSVTIETANSKGAPNWEVSETSLNTLIKLVAEIAKRNGLHPLVYGKTLTWHSMYVATECCGNYLKSKLQYIVDKANEMNNVGTNPPVEETKPYRVRLEADNAASQLGAFNSLDGAKELADNNKEYEVYDRTGKLIYDPLENNSFAVKVTVSALNIRSGAGTEYPVIGVIYDYGIYTITEIKNQFGKLKSGNGWIALDYTEKQ